MRLEVGNLMYLDLTHPRTFNTGDFPAPENFRFLIIAVKELLGLALFRSSWLS